MKRLMFGVLVVGFQVAVARSLVAEAVAWKVTERGNGNVYEVVLKEKKISWEEAKAEAEAKGGHLVTITSGAENDFVIGLLRDLEYWNQPSSAYRYYGPWIGAFQAEGAKEPDGGWAWVTGESFRWLSDPGHFGAPNDYWAGRGLNENRAQFFYFSKSPLNKDSIKEFQPIWNDETPDCYGGVVNCYVIEFEMQRSKRQLQSVQGSKKKQEVKK